MKRLTLSLMLVTGLVLAQQAAPPVGDVTLAWNPSQPLSASNTFVIRGSPTLTGDSNSWAILTNISGLRTQVTVRIQPGSFFFLCQSSNLWGLSSPSNVAAAPPLPASPLLSITGAQ